MSDDEDQSGEDPFERLEGSVDDREGDPFDRLEDTEDDDGSPTGSGRDPRSEPEPGYDAHDVTPPDHRDERDQPDDERDQHQQPASGAATQPGTEQTGNDQSEVVETDEPTVKTGQTVDPDNPFGDAGRREGDPFEDDVFEEMNVGELDPDEVWESLSDAEERGSVTEVQERRHAEVSKHRFCEQCEFFSEPPDIHCSHDGTEILEFIDHETVRVVDCPIVAEREELEQHE